MSNRRIGVFICHCGGNISDYVDVEQVRQSVEKADDVVMAKTHMFTCSDAAQTEMMHDIVDAKLDGLVIASCSPKLHLHTFRSMSARAGLNPYRYVQVNMREQCSWAHTNDKGSTRKAISLVEAGIAKARLTAPLTALRIDTIPKTLIIGAGVSGLRAALALARLGIHVFLIEKEKEPGGWVAGLGKLYPNGTSGRAMIDSLLEEVRKEENITLFTEAELVEKSGNIGNFQAKVKVAGQEDLTLNVGAIIVSSGFDVYTPAANEYGYGAPGVVTLDQYEKMLQDGDGPIRYNGRTVKSIAYIYCVGSRQTACANCPNPNTHCSRFCCTAAVHAAIQTQKRNKEAHQFHLYRDMRTYGKYELLYEEALRQGSVFLRFSPENPPVVQSNQDRLLVTVKDMLTHGEEIEIEPDLVVLVTGMVPRQDPQLIDVLKLPIGKDGFFNEIHPKLRPVETVVDGVFIAGACQGPKTISESVAASMAAVSKAAGLLKKGYVDLEPLVAKVDPNRCAWCNACTEACPYGAIKMVEFNGKQVAEIVPALCKGEGACVPVCPENALDIEGYTDEQVRAMISALCKETV